MRAALLAAVVTLLSPAAAKAAPSDALGRWLTEEGDAVVEISACGASLCGVIASVTRKTAGPVLDAKNEDPALRNRPVQGLQILSGFRQKGDGWIDGRIYSPKEGRSFKSKVLPLPDGRLKVEGCLAVICRAEIWTRA